MNRRTRLRLWRNAKVSAVCGAMVYLAAGVTGMGAELQKPDIPETVSAHVLEENAELPDGADENGTEELAVDEYYPAVMPVGWNEDESYLLAKIAMAEAEGEDTEGKALVIMVVLNRVLSEDFPGTVEEVIMEKHKGVHQFSVTQDGGRWWEAEPDADCYEAVDMVMDGWDESQGAMYFESRSNSTWHRDNLEFLFMHGSHYFYKDVEE